MSRHGPVLGVLWWRGVATGITIRPDSELRTANSVRALSFVSVVLLMAGKPAREVCSPQTIKASHLLLGLWQVEHLSPQGRHER
jgi:hypothetical protein